MSLYRDEVGRTTLTVSLPGLLELRWKNGVTPFLKGYIFRFTSLFLLGLGVVNDRSSEVCDYKPTKEKAAPNDVAGLAGVVGVEGRD